MMPGLLGQLIKSLIVDTHPEKRLVHRAGGEVHAQTYHVANPRPKMPPGAAPRPKGRPKEDRRPGPGAELTLVSMARRFSTEEAARKYMEEIRWPGGVACPKCGTHDVRTLTPSKEKKIRPGLHWCPKCRRQFTVTAGTVMADTKIPLNKWLLAFYVMAASKTQVSALQLQRQLEIGQYRTALFLCHRIRHALSEILPPEMLSGTVEADETWIGGKAEGQGRGYTGNKTAVVSMVERGGQVRSQVVDEVTGKVVADLLGRNVDPAAHLNTDESRIYEKAGRGFASHDTVNHGIGEYMRPDSLTGRKATTNTVEGYFGNTKRSISGTHHAISPRHTDLYLNELDFKYNTRHMTDGERAVAGIKRAEGRRVMQRELVAKPGSPKAEETQKALPPDDGTEDDYRMPMSEFDDIMRRVLGGPKRFVQGRLRLRAETEE